MPGVPPDAVDRLKKGIKGLFHKNKKSKDTESSKSAGEPSRTETSKFTTAQPEAAKSAEASKPTDDSTGAGGTAPTPAEEDKVTEPVKPEEAGSAARQEAKKDAVGSMPPEAKPREHAEGMSATSGPLQDDPEFAHATQ